MNIKHKIPTTQQATPVLAVIAFLLYGWTTYRFIQKIPSWLLFLTLPEIFRNYLHALAINLVETALFFALVWLINLALPAKWFKEKFVARGALFSALTLGVFISIALTIGRSKLSDFPWQEIQWMPVYLIMVFIAAILLPLFDPLRKFIEEVADRLIIFLYVLLPLSGIGLLVFFYQLIIYLGAS